ncbi:MAG: type II toxin-antitoxin system Phd/YefM family antitoxin [Syntrophobacteraceae bacterium]
MTQETVNVAEAKKRLSELIGRVAFGGEQIVITKRGKPMAKLTPVGQESKHLGEAKGWLEEEDEFFSFVENIIASRERHIPRMLEGRSEK